MAAQIPKSTILVPAVSVGGVVLTLIVFTTVYALVQCHRKRRLMSNHTATHWRLSRYPGGHLSLTPSEADRNRPSRSLRQLTSSRSPYGVWEGWKYMGSRDSLSRKSIVSGTSRGTALNISYPDLQLLNNGVPRPQAATRIRYPISDTLRLSPITERLSRDTSEDFLRTQGRMPDMVNYSQYTSSTQDSKTSEKPECRSPTHNQTKQYIRTHRRSVSTTSLQTIRDALPANSLVQPLGDETRSTMKRTFSLHSQHSGNAPIARMESPPPELPREIPRWSRVQALRSYPKDPGIRASTISSISISSSLYDDDVFGSPLHYETNFGSASLAFEPKKELPLPSSDTRKSWDVHEIQRPGATVCSDSFELVRAKPNFRQRESYESGIERHPLSRNPSSGLAPSLVDQYGPSRCGSNASGLNIFSKDIFNSSNLYRFVPQSGHDSSTVTLTSKQSNSPTTRMPCSSPKKESPLRASVSVLQETSGNKSSLLNDVVARPSSDPATQPFIWNEGAEMKPGKPSISKDRKEGHKRQSRQRISFTTSRPSSITFEAMAEELAEDNDVPSQVPALPGLLLTSPQRDRLLPQPPSIAAYEPRLRLPSTPNRVRQGDPGDYSKVVSVYESYTVERGASSEDLFPTPTRKPSSARPHDRRSKIAPGTPSHPLWLLREPFIQTAPQLSFTDSLQLSFMEDDDLTSDVQQTVVKHPAPNSRTPDNCSVRGPRVPPLRWSPTRRSPNRGLPMRSARRSPTRPLALAVSNQLRKKNSEIFDSDARYLNMGTVDILEGTPEIEDREEFEPETPKCSLPKVHDIDDSNLKQMDRVQRGAKRRTEVLGLGVTGGHEQSDCSPTSETIYSQVNHFNAGT